jgi:hypothetical protein
VATRALEYVLGAQPGLLGLRTFLKDRFHWSGELCRIGAQHRSPEDGQPDLFGIDAAGTTTFLAEVKFWAELTGKQPNAYLNLLCPCGLLLFVAPEARQRQLWAAVCKRLGISEPSDNTPFVDKENKRVGIVSGIGLVDALLADMHGLDSKATAVRCDLVQVRALWSEYDHLVTELQPISERDLNNSVWPQLALTLPTLPAKILEAARKDEVLKAETWSEGREVSLTYVYKNIRLSRMQGWIVYSPENWEKYGDTSESGRNGLYEGATEREWKAIAVPLRVLPNVPESDVIDNIVQQLRKINEVG